MKNKYLKPTMLLISMAAFNSSATAQDTPAERAARQEAAIVMPGSLTNVIADGATFSTLTAALKAAGLDATLGGKDMLTVFAPTDEAFDKLPKGMLTQLLLPENKEKLRMLLLYHVVSGKVLAAELVDGEVKTVNGEKLAVKVSTDRIEIDGHQVLKSNVSASNGVMHSIGQVLIPDSLKEFAGLDK